MIIHYIYKSTAVQPVVRPEKFFCLPGSFMLIGKGIYYTMQGNPLLNPGWIIKFLFSFYKIADKIAYQYFRMIERKICMSEIVDKFKLIFEKLPKPIRSSKITD